MVSFNTHVSEAQVTIGLITVLYNFNFDCLVTNLLLKNFRFSKYAFVPRAILSLISSSIELLAFITDPKYLYCWTWSICKLLMFGSHFWFLLLFFCAFFRYLVFSSFIINPSSTELFFNCLNVSISDCFVHAVISMSSA